MPGLVPCHMFASSSVDTQFQWPKKDFTPWKEIKETQDHELLYHSDAHRCSHHSSLSIAGPFVPLSKRVFVFLRMSWLSLYPSCRKCKRTSWKASVCMVPCKVKGELPSLSHSRHLLPGSRVQQTLLTWCDRKCLSYRYWTSCS